jgi:putative inorganic carbon (HCO3(-)) transporter
MPLARFYNNYRTVILTGLVFVIINSLLVYKEIFYLPILPVIVIVAWLLITSLEKSLFLIVFFVPLSIPLSTLAGDIGLDLYLPTEPLLAAVMVIFFIKYLRGQLIDINILRHPVTLAIYFQLSWIFITSITSTMPVVSFKFLIARLWFVISFYLIAAEAFKNPKRIRQYIWVYVVPFGLVVAYVLIRHAGLGLSSQQAAHFVVQPFYKDHTSYGAVLAMILPVLIGLLISYKKLDSRIIFLFILLILYFTAAILFSYTRAAWLSLIVAFGLWVIIKLKIKLPLVFLGAAIVFAGIFSMRTEILMKLEKNKQASSGNLTEHVQSMSNIRNDESNLERLNRWSSAIRMFREKPVFGWGPGTYMFKYAPFQVTKQKTSISTNTGRLGNAHSEYLGPLAESGLLGMLSFLMLFFVTILTGFRVIYHSERRFTRVLATSVLLGLITYYIHGIMNNFLDTDKASVLFWGFTAMLVSMDLFHMKKKKPQ